MGSCTAASAICNVGDARGMMAATDAKSGVIGNPHKSRGERVPNLRTSFLDYALP